MKRITVTKNLLASMLLLGALSGCQKGKDGAVTISFKQAPGTPLAQVGDFTITVEEAKKDFLERQGTFQGAPHLNTDKKRSEFVENLVVQEVLWQEFLAQPEIPREVLNAWKKAAVRDLMQKKVAEAQQNYTPTEAEMKEYYEKNPGYFKHEEAFKIAFLGVPFGTDKKKAKEIAQQLQTEAAKTVKNSDTRAFAQLAMKYAQESKGTGKGHFSIEANESGYLEKEAFETKFGKEAYDIVQGIEAIGNVGPLLTTDTSFYVFMKTGQRKKLDESFEDAKPKIAKRLAFERRGQIYENFIAGRKEKYKVKVFEEKIAELSKDITPPRNVAQGNEGSPGPMGTVAAAAAEAATEALAKRVPQGAQAVPNVPPAPSTTQPNNNVKE